MKQAIKAYRQLCRARQVAGLFVALPGTLVLLGWLLDVAALKSLLPRLETMKANTAICFLLAGLALWLWPKPGAEDWRRLAAQVCAVLIWLIGLLTLGEYVTGLNFGLDELLFRDEPLSPVTAYPGRMGPNTALGFVLGGAALMWAQSDGWRARWSHGCALLVGLLGFITLIGYGYSLIQLTRFSSSNSMALHTALGFLVLAFGLLCLRPEAGVMALALSDGLAGMVLRRLLPLIVLLLIALDWLIEQGVRVGWYGAEWHRPLFTVAGVVVLSWLVWRNALALARLEAARDKAEREGHRLDEQMHVTLRSIGDAVIATDAAGRVTFLNEVAQTLTGWTAEQASGRPVTEVFQIINEATRATVESPVEKVLREGRIVGLANHTILVARDGRELPIDDSGAPIRDATGRITGVVLVFRDISERKEAEQARTHLAAIAESSQDAMVTFSLDGRFLTWNAGAEKMFGYTAEEVIRQPVMMFVPEDKQAEARQILERRARGETIPPLETLRRRRDGSLIDVSLAVSPLTDISGRSIGSPAALRNITEHKQAEEKLHASEAQLAAEASALGRLNDASSRLWRMSGLQEGLDEMLAATIEMLGADFGNIQLLDAERGVLRIVAQRGFKPDFLDFFREVTTGDDSACGRALRAGERTIVEDVETDAPYAPLRAVARAAGYRAVQSTPLLGRDGAPLGMFSTHWRSPRRPSEQDLRRLDLYVRQAADFIKRIRSEEALRASEERLRISQQAAQVGTFDWNIETGLNTWTPQLEAMYGLPPGGFAGTQPAWESLLYPADRAGAVAKVDAALRTGELTEGEWRVVWPDGSVHWLVGRFQAFKDSSGKAVRLIGVNLDITERKQAEEKLRESEERFRLGLAASPIAVFNCDRDLRFTWVYNPQLPVTNPALILGRRDDEILPPESVGELLEIKRRVLESGIGERREIKVAHPQGISYFDYGVEPMLDANGAIIGLRGATTDITERKRREMNAAFLAEISQDLTLLSGEREIMRRTAEKIGAYLDVSHCVFAEYNEELTHITVDYDSSRDNERDFTGTYRLADFAPAEILARLAAGSQMAINDVATDARAARGKDRLAEFEVRATVNTPYLSDGRWKASLSVHSREPRQWREDELELLRELSARIWVRIERARAEEALRESEERFSKAFRASPLVLTISSLETGELIEVNDTFVNTTGYTREEAIGRTTLDLGLWKKPGDRAEEMETVRQRGQVSNAEYAFRTKAGAELTGLLAAERIEIGGRPCALTVIQDITERKQAEEKIRQSEERFRQAADASKALVYEADLLSGETAIAYGLERVTGYDPQQFTPSSAWWHSLIHPEDLPAHLAGLEKNLRQGGTYLTEYRVRHQTGKWIIVQDNGVVINDNGSPVRLVGAITDITERKQAEEALHAAFEQETAARAEAQFANQSKDEFLSVVTHELRSPLNAILGYARLARTSAGNATEVIKHCNVIERAARTQQQLIDDLLDTARIVSGKFRLEVKPCDLRLVVEDALAVVRPAAEAKAITLGAQSDLSSVQLIADAARLQQVVWNLLQNAIKFTPAGGRVEVHLEADERRVCLSVSDNGKGIPPEFLPRIFDRFSQNDMSLSRRYGGLGLGLALVRQIVELHGGEVSATSDGEGCGATFTVSLPLRAPQPVISLPAFIQSGEVRTDEAALPTDNLPSLEGLCILAADDQAEARELIATALRESGARVMAVSSGLEVLALLADPPPGAKPDILLLDISMPDEDGYSVLKRVRALEAERGIPPPERLPAIALTAHTRAQDRLDALAAGFQMHVGKPLELAELIVVIASIMSGRRK